MEMDDTASQTRAAGNESEWQTLRLRRPPISAAGMQAGKQGKHANLSNGSNNANWHRQKSAGVLRSTSSQPLLACLLRFRRRPRADLVEMPLDQATESSAPVLFAS
jgi:hypothetical protein